MRWWKFHDSTITRDVYFQQLNGRKTIKVLYKYSWFISDPIFHFYSLWAANTPPPNWLSVDDHSRFLALSRLPLITYGASRSLPLPLHFFWWSHSESFCLKYNIWSSQSGSLFLLFLSFPCALTRVCFCPDHNLPRQQVDCLRHVTRGNRTRLRNKSLQPTVMLMKGQEGA